MIPKAICTDKNIEYLVRRFTLEKGYAVVGDAPGADGEPILRSLDPKRFGYDLPVVYIEALEPLKASVDVLLLRLGGSDLSILGLSVYDGQSLAHTLSRETLIEVGQALTPEDAKPGKTAPIWIYLMEVHRDEPRAEAVEQLQQLRVPHDTSPYFQAWPFSVGMASGTALVDANLVSDARGQARYLRRILKETHEPEHRMVERVQNAGLHFPALIGGILVGAALSFGLRFLFASLGIEWGSLYGFADYVGAFTTIGVSIYARRIRSASLLQGFLGGLGFALLLYGGFIVVLGAPVTFVLVFNAFVYTFTGAAIGHSSEMA